METESILVSFIVLGWFEAAFEDGLRGEDKEQWVPSSNL
jgi:hypothetical protein